MKKKLKCILLIDDSHDDNFFHEREIIKNNSGSIVVTKNTGMEALEYLKTDKSACVPPDLIFLDINMPGMNGWEFLQEYNNLSTELQSEAVIIMLTTSDNSDDIAKAKTWDIISDYITKPLTKEMMMKINEKYFME
jgi:CheY-like chemotaxis protein